MSNMKDYAMWLDDKGHARWDNSIGELVTIGDNDLYSDELVEDYRTDKVWHGIEDDDLIEDEPEEELEDEDEAGDSIAIQVNTVLDLLDMVFGFDVPVANQFRDLIDTDMLTRLWDIRTTLNDATNPSVDQSEYWFDDDGGLTGDAQNYLHELDSKGELV